MKWPRLFDGLRARPTDPATSHQAAARAEIPHSQDYLLHVLAYYGPCSDEQIQDHALDERIRFPRQVPRWSDSRLRTARIELVRQGLVVRSEDVVQTSFGRPAAVWKLAADDALKNTQVAA